MAGSGIRGQFEEKFKALIRDIEDEVCLCPISPSYPLTMCKAGGVICFIDEVRMSPQLISCSSILTNHLDTLFNLGKAEGSIDGGQMIKPALARGLQLVGATTRAFLRTSLRGRKLTGHRLSGRV
jgi:ATP-dependent Clp protease ATP-binding subunit ClpB